MCLPFSRQLVLQHLKSRYDVMLTLDLLIFVAKALSAVEQLLLQTEDLEMYANARGKHTLRPSNHFQHGLCWNFCCRQASAHWPAVSDMGAVVSTCSYCLSPTTTPYGIYLFASFGQFFDCSNRLASAQPRIVFMAWLAPHSITTA